MKHEDYKELLQLNIWGELNNQEETDLENHLLECNECNEEYTKLKKMYSIVTTEKHEIPSEIDLLNARKRLFNVINEKSTFEIKNPKLNRNYFNLFTSKINLAFGSISLILVGLFIGYFLFSQINSSTDSLTINTIDVDKVLSGELKLNKVKIPDVFSESELFEFTLSNGDYKGSLEDINVQQLLAYAITKTKNPGFKIKTAKAVVEKMSDNVEVIDSKIKEALIQTLKEDTNPGVRKNALRALSVFPFDNDIRDAMLFTLENDVNSSNRIDAINTLLDMSIDTYSIDNSLKAKLENGLQNEINEVVKVKTTKLLLGGN